MWTFKWERHDYNRLEKKHIKTSEGEFLSGNLQGAKSKATRQSGIGKVGSQGKREWKLTTVPQAFSFVGRCYICQQSTRPEYENRNPKLYLTIVKYHSHNPSV